MKHSTSLPAEVELDRLAYEQLDRAGIEPEMMRSATALDGVCSCGATFNEYGQCEACGPELPPPAAPSDALARIRLAKIAALAESTSTADPSHGLITPDPAECPDISAPQPVGDLSACERYSTAPMLTDLEPADVPPSEPEHDPCAEMRAELQSVRGVLLQLVKANEAARKAEDAWFQDANDATGAELEDAHATLVICVNAARAALKG